MTSYERKMVSLLTELRDQHSVVGVKAEFEAEGTRMEEALRLKEVVTKAGLGLVIKIGGCEALRDLYEARTIGVSRIVAPMIESPYALRKFLQAFTTAFPEEERVDVVASINVETIDAVHRLDDLLAVDELPRLNGIVVGRVDLCHSMGLTRDDINTDHVMRIAGEVMAKAKRRNLVCGIGGGVSADSLPAFRRFPAGHLDYYETRKVVFGCPAALGEDASSGTLKAVEFELLWLKNKRDYYGLIFAEDRARIEMLESRYRRAFDEIGVRG